MKKLTGYERASFQLRWCVENGVRAWLSAAGEVVVPRSAIDGTPQAKNDPAWAPDFTKIRGQG